jgi:hypothetical protein
LPKKKPSPPRFKLAAPRLSESDLHEECAKVLDAVLLEPARWCCYPAGAAQLSRQQAAAYSRKGLKRGYPDLLFYYRDINKIHAEIIRQVRDTGTFDYKLALGGCWGIELKTAGGYMSRNRIVHTRRGAPRLLEGQLEVCTALLESGGFSDIKIATSVDEMLGWLRQWGFPLRSLKVN